MMIIYFGTVPLYISKAYTDNFEKMKREGGLVIAEGLTENELDSLLSAVSLPQAKAGLLIHPSPDDALKAIKQKFLVIQAAGGAVFTADNQLLLIFRRGKWDLPKGKLDEGEKLETCAIREVEEETGARNIQLEKWIKTTYHTYEEGGKKILKETWWYLMRVMEAQPLHPQTNEDIQECRWVSLNSLAPYLNNIQPSVMDVINQVYDEITNKSGQA